MTTMRFSMMLFAAMAPATALAAPAPVQRLSEAQVEQVLADAAARREAAEAVTPKPKLQVHGEVGVEVGTGGHRALYGSAFVPLGEESGAIVSFSTETARHDRRRSRNER